MLEGVGIIFKKYSPFMEGKLWAIMCLSTTLQKSYKVFMSMIMLDLCFTINKAHGLKTFSICNARFISHFILGLVNALTTRFLSYIKDILRTHKVYFPLFLQYSSLLSSSYAIDLVY
jgi:hypothetical protein